jgi:sterol 3beta-glucosyltransferase
MQEFKKKTIEKMSKLFLILTFLLLTTILSFLYWLETSFLRSNIAHIDNIWTSYGAQLDWDGKRPLNILFLSWGSRGDHQPNVALGLELAKRGHNVTILGLEKYKYLIERYEPKIKYYPLEDEDIWVLASNMNSNADCELSHLRDYIQNSSKNIVSQYLKAIATGGSGSFSDNDDVDDYSKIDVLFGSFPIPIFFHHLTVAQATKKPIFFTTHDPGLPTEYYSYHPGTKLWNDYGRRKNILFGNQIPSILFGILMTLGNTPFRTLRKDLGLPTSFPIYRYTHSTVLTDFPIFDTSDIEIWPRPLDWPKHWVSTGVFQMPSNDNDAVTDTTDNNKLVFHEREELQTWIDSRKEYNRPILFFGQGSFTSHDKATNTEIIIDTCEKLQMDAIALTTTVDFKNINRPAFLQVVDEADFDSIFPQCSVIVHHGGAGTMSHIVRSATPSICIPYLPFQVNWGAKLEDLGIGTLLHSDLMLDIWKKNGTNLLQDAVERVMHPSIQKMATELATKVQQRSGGVQVAADSFIETLLSFQVSNARKGNTNTLKNDL